MNTDRWRELLDRISVDGEVRPVDESRLDAYEHTTGRLLPGSYRAYASVFGFGTIIGAASAKIAVPGSADWYWDEDLELLNEELRSHDGELKAFTNDAELWTNAVFFGTDSGDRYLWDTRDVSSGSSGEMGVHIIFRDRRIFRLCDTFESFVFDICLNQGVPDTVKCDDPAEFWAWPDSCE